MLMPPFTQQALLSFVAENDNRLEAQIRIALAN